MSLYEIPLSTLAGEPASLPTGKALLLVNVASRCGLTPQYTGLEELQKTYGDRAFPLFEKLEVNGEGRHPLFAELTAVPDAEGQAGDVQWNFEKWLVSPDGEVVGRFRPLTEPTDPALLAAIEAQLPG
jgi:glutathione peroxidase